MASFVAILLLTGLHHKHVRMVKFRGTAAGRHGYVGWSGKRRYSMIRLTVIPRFRDNLYGLLVAKEVELRRKARGTLHRSGPKKRGHDKWTHKTYSGWINLQRGVDGTLAATVRSRDAEWKLLTSLIGFLDRHFRKQIASVTINYDRSGE
jgi:hypothetical protein